MYPLERPRVLQIEGHAHQSLRAREHGSLLDAAGRFGVLASKESMCDVKFGDGDAGERPSLSPGADAPLGPRKWRSFRMNNQNVTNYGNNNVSNQYNGDVSLASLGICELVEEDRLAVTVVKSERKRRFALAGVGAVICVIAIGVGYALFLNFGELSWAEVFNNFGAALLGPLLGPALSAVLALLSGAFAVGRIQSRSEIETENLDRRKMIESIVLSKGYTRRDWRNAKKGKIAG